jgi:hypothetical protein
MGKKTKFKLDDWLFPEEKNLSQTKGSDTELPEETAEQLNQLEKKLQSKYAERRKQPKAGTESDKAAENTDAERPMITIKVNAPLKVDSGVDEEASFDLEKEHVHVDFTQTEASLEGLSQDEIAFKRQVEDLFELLEMEKAADESEGVRVYQTDTAPSRPWRFH